MKAPNKLREWRLEHGYTQTQLALLIGIGYQQYQRYEYGREFPNLETAFKICRVINDSVENIWEYSCVE